MNKVIELGFMNDSLPLILTEVNGSAIVKTGIMHNAPSYHFEVTTIWGDPLLLSFFQGQGITVDTIMGKCFAKRDATIRELTDGTGYVCFMLGRVVGSRIQVRTAFVHKIIVDLVSAPQLWSGEIPVLEAA